MQKVHNVDVDGALTQLETILTEEYDLTINVANTLSIDPTRSICWETS